MNIKTEFDDGGPAFPHIPSHGSREGMTLRDWFAGLAMSGFCADPSNHEVFDGMEDMAINAYRVADAMLAAREGGAA